MKLGTAPGTFQGLEGPITIKLFRRIALAVAATFVLALAAFGAVSMVGLPGSEAGQMSQVDRSQPVLLKSVQEMSQYHAAVGNFEVLLDIEEDVAWVPELIAGQRTLFVAAGTVNSYVDLSGLADNDLEVSADRKSATVRLPEPELDKANLNFDRSYIYDQDRGIINRVVDALETPEHAEIYQLAEAKMATAAEESELRAQATENTKAMLTGMFGSLGMDVTFREEASE